MDAVIRGTNGMSRRVVALILALAALALVAGGTAGYLVRGYRTVTVTHTVYAPTHAAPATSSEYFGVIRTTAGFIPGL